MNVFDFVCVYILSFIYTRPTKQRMQKVANISILSMFIMYLLTAIFGYLTFYGKHMLLLKEKNIYSGFISEYSL